MAEKKQTVKAFLRQNSGAPIDEEVLAERASRVEGEVGEKAKALLKARREFDGALEAIGFEHG